MTTNWTAVADALGRVADALERMPHLDPDAAVRLVVWGHPETPYPGDDAPGADLFDEVSSLIECATGWQGNGIADVPVADAITAARSEAARIRSFG
jgi:hypothetical protein